MNPKYKRECFERKRILHLILVAVLLSFEEIKFCLKKKRGSPEMLAPI